MLPPSIHYTPHAAPIIPDPPPPSLLFTRNSHRICTSLHSFSPQAMVQIVVKARVMQALGKLLLTLLHSWARLARRRACCRQAALTCVTRRRERVCHPLLQGWALSHRLRKGTLLAFRFAFQRRSRYVFVHWHVWARDEVGEAGGVRRGSMVSGVCDGDELVGSTRRGG